MITCADSKDASFDETFGLISTQPLDRNQVTEQILKIDLSRPISSVASFKEKVKKITADGKTKDKTARLMIYKDMLQYLPNVILDYVNDIALKSITNGNDQSYETLKPVPSRNN
ncbi:hypothetical protein RhiirA4_468683 [Rhizophagus irregularis]|uniref:Uncharacterized protein n=1 Tax=Rhizophagus irregularis TaxID=588596 RepID=A0A2I1GY56_9GLOM|nr:hypothetical protein RhiirA4_468683 [Rhizophagus irregularis]